MTHCVLRDSMIAVTCVSAFGLSVGQYVYISATKYKIGDFIIVAYRNALKLGVFAGDFVCLSSAVIGSSECAIVGKAEPMIAASTAQSAPEICRIN